MQAKARSAFRVRPRNAQSVETCYYEAMEKRERARTNRRRSLSLARSTASGRIQRAQSLNAGLRKRATPDSLLIPPRQAVTISVRAGGGRHAKKRRCCTIPCWADRLLRQPASQVLSSMSIARYPVHCVRLSSIRSLSIALRPFPGSPFADNAGSWAFFGGTMGHYGAWITWSGFGVNCLWLTPIFLHPRTRLRSDGLLLDPSNAWATYRFSELVAAAHGQWLVLDFVANHLSL